MNEHMNPQNHGNNGKRQTRHSVKLAQAFNRPKTMQTYEILLIERDEVQRKAFREYVQRCHPNCRLCITANAYDAVDILTDKFKKGRSFDLVVFGYMPGMPINDFLNDIEAAMKKTNTVIKTIGVCPVFNKGIDEEMIRIRKEIDVFKQKHEKEGSVPRIAVSKTESRYGLYAQITNVVRRVVGRIDSTRMYLESQLEEEAQRKNKDTQNNENREGETNAQ